MVFIYSFSSLSLSPHFASQASFSAPSMTTSTLWLLAYLFFQTPTTESTSIITIDNTSLVGSKAVIHASTGTKTPRSDPSLGKTISHASGLTPRLPFIFCTINAHRHRVCSEAVLPPNCPYTRNGFYLRRRCPCDRVHCIFPSESLLPTTEAQRVQAITVETWPNLGAVLCE